MGGYVRCYAWFDEWYVSFNRFGRRKFVKFDNIYVFLFEKSVLINLLITSKYRVHENFYPLENIWSVFYSSFEMFIVKKNVDSSKFPIFFLCTKVGFFKINETAKWYCVVVENFNQNSILHKQLFSRRKNSCNVIRPGWS